MTTLPGMHYCKEHQGNTSHYDPANCDLCKTKAKLQRLATAVKELRKYPRGAGIPLLQLSELESALAAASKEEP